MYVCVFDSPSSSSSSFFPFIYSDRRRPINLYIKIWHANCVALVCLCVHKINKWNNLLNLFHQDIILLYIRYWLNVKLDETAKKKKTVTWFFYHSKKKNNSSLAHWTTMDFIFYHLIINLKKKFKCLRGRRRVMVLKFSPGWNFFLCVYILF